MQPATRRRLRLALRLLVLGGVGVGAFRIFAPQLRSTEGFVAFAGEPRLRYEPGAERAAAALAPALSRAIAAVETGHFRAFARPVVVHVCATEQSFERFGFGVKGAGGFVYAGRLFLSPKPQNTAERLPRLTTHELSHLHLEQATGFWWATGRIPVWFKEGLAVHVSGGAGAENVSEADARAAITQGRVFRRDETGAYLFRQTPARDGLPPHLFYREAALFVGFLARRPPARAFEHLLISIEDRRDFAATVRESYGRTLGELWDEFTAETAGVR